MTTPQPTLPPAQEIARPHEQRSDGTLSDDLERGNAALTALQRSGLRLKESEDTYPHVVVQDGKHRIIECRDRIQWILQRREGERRWTSISYCRWRVTLLRLCKHWSEDALAVIRALPEGIEA